MLPFGTCWHRVARAEIHRQALTKLWNCFDANSTYTSRSEVDSNGAGKFFIKPVDRAWMLPFSLEFGEFLYQLRGALDACVYDAAALHFGQNPPPDEEKWQFPIAPDSAEFNNAMGRMKKIPNDIRGIIESVQPDTTTTASFDGGTWYIGKTLEILNNWARIDRHRRLHFGKTAITSGRVSLILPPGMTQEFFSFNGGTLLEDESEVARFKIANYVRGTNAYVDCQLAFEVIVDESPRSPLKEASTAMMTSVQVVREMFEKHFGLEGQQYDLSAAE